MKNEKQKRKTEAKWMHWRMFDDDNDGGDDCLSIGAYLLTSPHNLYLLSSPLLLYFQPTCHLWYVYDFGYH